MSNFEAPRYGYNRNCQSSDASSSYHQPINSSTTPTPNQNGSYLPPADDTPKVEVPEYSKKGQWSQEEDDTLQKYARDYLFSGKKATKRLDWRPVAAHIPGRNSKQCRERYINHLDPGIVRGHWKAHEDAKLLRLVPTAPNQWAKLSRQIPGRTENMVKVRFHTLMRLRVKNDLPKPLMDIIRQTDGVGMGGKIEPWEVARIEKRKQNLEEDQQKEMRTREASATSPVARQPVSSASSSATKVKGAKGVQVPTVPKAKSKRSVLEQWAEKKKQYTKDNGKSIINISPAASASSVAVDDQANDKTRQNHGNAWALQPQEQQHYTNNSRDLGEGQYQEESNPVMWSAARWLAELSTTPSPQMPIANHQFNFNPNPSPYSDLYNRSLHDRIQPHHVDVNVEVIMTPLQKALKAEAEAWNAAVLLRTIVQPSTPSTPITQHNSNRNPGKGQGKQTSHSSALGKKRKRSRIAGESGIASSSGFDSIQDSAKRVVGNSYESASLFDGECQYPGSKCTGSSMGLTKGLCAAHGGQMRCKHKSSTCQEPANPERGLCPLHGGYRKRCRHESECNRHAQVKGLCSAHGGVRLCKYQDCKRQVQAKGRCRTHENANLPRD